ncbi:hypothetical protein AK812_SmicGene36929 [Symbiodinium microadriaticum]|uniref:Uncharacterized protein n=1 Tax=Symbiodinium microadriaticum TaxID=2951 RepID=A0A1Q9CHT2_SYMMI|nr:hypothetical protein AK812_SmicGene36929 [Symbiodinium microadriaticum]
MPVSQSSLDGLRRDVDRLNQPLRIVLLGFVVLKELFSNLKAEHKLAEFPKQAAPAILAALKETLPAEAWCAPQLSGPANQIRPALREIQGNNLRVFIDRSIRGLPKGKGKGQGPGRNKGKSKGQKATPFKFFLHSIFAR